MSKLIDGFKILLARCFQPRLRSALNVKSHMTFDEKLVLFKISQNCSLIVEIGSYTGASACCFGASAVKSNKKIICIDTWNNYAMSEGPLDTWADFQRNTQAFSDCIIAIRGFSADVVGQVRKISGQIDLLFIDGDHSYSGVKSDWEAYKQFLRCGSTVVFHDYGWAEGVRRVVHDDVVPLVSDYHQLPNMWWGTLGENP